MASDPLCQSQLLVQATKLEPTNTQNKPVNDTVPADVEGKVLPASGRAFQTHLEELLDDVVSEDVHHELVRRLQNLTEDKLALC